MNNSWVRRFNGRPYLFSKRFRNKNEAGKFASNVRVRGYNARVVNWVGGSGVYIGRRYDRSKSEARQAWLNQIQKEYNTKGIADAFSMPGAFTGSVKKISVQPFFHENESLAVRLIEQEGGRFDGLEWLTFDDRIRLNAANTKDDVGDLYAHPYNPVLNANEQLTHEKALVDLATDELVNSWNDLPIFPGNYDEEELELYRIIKAKENVEPVVGNDGFGNTAMNFTFGGPKRIGDSAIWGWGVNVNDSEDSPARFKSLKIANEDQPDLARWHVVVTYPTKNGFEETPVYAFDTEEKAENFARKFETVGRERGEYLLDFAKIPQNDMFTKQVKGGIFLPYSDVDINIVKETQFSNSQQIERDMEKSRRSMNLPSELGGNLGNNVPGSKAVKEMFDFQERKMNEKERMEAYYEADWNSQFAPNLDDDDYEGDDFEDFLESANAPQPVKLDPDEFLEDIE